MISRPPSLRRLDPFEAELGEIERIDERVDRSNRVVLVDPVVQAFRKQRALAAIYSLDKALHPIPRKSRWNRTSRVTSGGTFSHGLGQTRPFAAVCAQVSSTATSRHWSARLV